jgi:molybdopterin-guanine dinucleotide biosynthesis protein A
MGRDKAQVSLGGLALLEHSVSAVAEVCETVIIAGGDRPPGRIGADSVVWVADPPAAAGPLAGILAGLLASPHPAAVVVACDMPFVKPDFLRHLLDLLEGCDAVVPLAAGRAQPLHAAYSRASIAGVQSVLRLGGRSVADLLPRLRVRYLGEERCADMDSDGLSCFNVNTPEDLRLAREIWALRENYAGEVPASRLRRSAEPALVR